MSDNWTMRLDDILFRIEKIQRYCHGKTYDEFMDDEQLVDAVERNFEVIGEASNFIPANVKDQYPEIPWSALYGMRNHIVHGYGFVEFGILWQTAQTKLDDLKAAIERIKSTL